MMGLEATEGRCSETFNEIGEQKSQVSKYKFNSKCVHFTAPVFTALISVFVSPSIIRISFTRNDRNEMQGNERKTTKIEMCNFQHICEMLIHDFSPI